MIVNTDKQIMHSYYVATAPRVSFGVPLNGACSTDVCIVGGGFAGLSAAIELAQKGFAVTVLEAQHIGWGASGRNGGQVIVGHGVENAFIEQLDRSDARRCWDTSVEGVNLLRQRINEHAIDCEWQTGWLYVATNPRKAEALRKDFELVRKNFAYPHWHWIDPGYLSEHIRSERYHSGFFDTLSGHLHPLKYCQALARLAVQNSVHIAEYSKATAFEKRGDKVLVHTANGMVEARYLLLAGNVYLGALARAIQPRIMPATTYIAATEVLGEQIIRDILPLREAVCNNNFILDYFRPSADNRLLFGGRVSFVGVSPTRLQEIMKNRMLATFPQLAKNIKIDYHWGGQVDVTRNFAPDFGRLDDNIYYLQGFNGHGVALTGIAGKLVAEAIAGQAERFDVYARLKHKKFPGGTLLRRPTRFLGVLWYHLRDLI